MGNIKKMKHIERKQNGHYKREREAKEWYNRVYGKANRLSPYKKYKEAGQ